MRRRVAGFDAALHGLGPDAGDVVGVLGLNSAAHLVSWLAIPRSGRVLNDLNYRLATAELEFILGDSSARVLMVDDAYLDAGRALLDACPTVEHLIYMGAGETPDGCLSFIEMTETPGSPPATVDPDALAGIFYTGGTTGLPKGAMLTHRNLVVNAKHTLIAFGYVGEDSYLHAAPMFHVADGASTYALTFVGAKHVSVPAFDPQLWLSTVQDEQITRALLVPTMVNMVVNDPAVADYDLSSLKSVWYGASPMRHSGDAAYLDADGYLYIVDRVKDMIISGGENVYCTEVENAIYQHAAVLECAVFGVPDDRWGECVHAAIVLKPNTSADQDAIIDHCRALIAGYKLPRSIDFHTDPLPKSGAGKLLKRDLRKPYWEGKERQVS